jgi:hypothetical protein
MSRPDCDVAVVGGGPYGLATAARLREHDSAIDVRVFGRPMSFWESMPVGMCLRSRWEASQIGYPTGELSLDAFREEAGREFDTPVLLDDFVDYGRWFQQKAVPDLDQRSVSQVERLNGGYQLELEDGTTVGAGRVVVAAGIGAFPAIPEEFAHLPSELVSHTSAHTHLDVFKGRSVAVVGGGQSALESAALLHESGATVRVFTRADRIIWLKGGVIQKKLGPAKPLFYAPTDVGPIGLSRILAVPGLFTKFPCKLQTRLARRSIRPAGAKWLVPRLEEVSLEIGRSVVAAEPYADGLKLRLDDGTAVQCDHLLCGTGYKVDVARYDFLSPRLLETVKTVGGYPVLGHGLESSARGLHFLGAPAAWSFGPILRFVSGSWFATVHLSRAITKRRLH